MSPAAKTALLASITHWEENAKATCRSRVEIYSEGCALCGLFRNGPAVQDTCESSSLCYNSELEELCPVAERTQQEECAGSPWSKVMECFISQPFIVGEFQAAARAELAFLKSLLPPEPLA